MNDRLLSLRPYPMGVLAARRRALEAKGLCVFDFGTGDPLDPTAPRIREAWQRSVPAVSRYPTVRGGAALREAFAAWFHRRFAVRLDPDSEVLPSQGSKEAIFHLPLVLVDPSREPRMVLHPSPGYPVYGLGALFAGAETLAWPLREERGFLMDPDEIGDEVLARCALVWLNHPHNPTGADLPDRLWKRWTAARERHGFVLASDECYTEIWTAGRPRSLLEFGRGNCLVFHSLSKRSGMTGYRSGMVAGDPELVALYARFREGMGVAMPAPTEAASIAAWNDEEHVEERRRAFARRRQVMAACLASAGLAVFPSTSTFYLWARVPPERDGGSYAERLLEAGILVAPGAWFGPGNEDWIRLAMVPGLEECEEAARRWKEVA